MGLGSATTEAHGVGGGLRPAGSRSPNRGPCREGPGPSLTPTPTAPVSPNMGRMFLSPTTHPHGCAQSWGSCAEAWHLRPARSVLEASWATREEELSWAAHETHAH